jgi:DNA-directed RNA polymerase subunit M/transcription elongation factor TFIIS
MSAGFSLYPVQVRAHSQQSVSSANKDLHGLVNHLRSKGMPVERVVFCPECLDNAGIHQPMVFRDMPNGRHYYCTRCGKRLEAD